MQIVGKSTEARTAVFAIDDGFHSHASVAHAIQKHVIDSAVAGKRLPEIIAGD